MLPDIEDLLRIRGFSDLDFASTVEYLARYALYAMEGEER
jgi:hypothetical protein